jgi:hypothetical protein
MRMMKLQCSAAISFIAEKPDLQLPIIHEEPEARKSSRPVSPHVLVSSSVSV